MLGLLQFTVATITTVIVFLFSSYLTFNHSFDVYKHRFFSNINDLQEYDYIVVGSGSAGALLSTKLAKNADNVLLLEAGGNAPPFLDIPLLAPLIQNTPYDWQYITVPQQHACKGLINKQSKWPMGKILGGTSRLNYMLYVRGHPSDYNEYFPDFTEPTKENGGPVPVNEAEWNTDLANIILKGLKELHQDIGDINKDLKNGFMKAQLSMENGKRWSSDRLLYNDFKDKLKIITHAHVAKVLMESKKAVGVEFFLLNKTYKAMAKKGVILSAGAIGTPKILMLSGIGPRKHLEDLKINVVSDLPVGQNLVDHVLTGLDLVVLNTSMSLSMIDTLNPVSAIDYFFHGKGPWTSSGVEVLGTLYSSLKQIRSKVPDLQIIAMPLGLSKDNGVVLKKAIGIPDEVYNKYFVPISRNNTITIAPVLLHPKSKGEVQLISNNPFDAPLIDPKYLSDKDDVEILVDGLQFVKKLIETDAMKAIGASMYDKHFPGCENEIFDSKKYWECYVQHLTLTSYHPASTCRMGDVVDQTFRIYGTTNLYVVDASVLPTLPSGNINAAVMMLAEKAARAIKQNTKFRVNNFKCYKPSDYHIFDSYFNR